METWIFLAVAVTVGYLLLSQIFPFIKYLLWWPGYLILLLSYFWPSEWGYKRNTAGSRRRWDARDWMAPLYSLVFYGGLVFFMLPLLVARQNGGATPAAPTAAVPSTATSSPTSIEPALPAPRPEPALTGSSESANAPSPTVQAPIPEAAPELPAPALPPAALAPSPSPVPPPQREETPRAERRLPAESPRLVDCEHPLGIRARLVCSTPRLSLLNRQAQDALNALPDTFPPTELNTAHARWAHDSSRCQDKVSCLASTYEQLIADLKP